MSADPRLAAVLEGYARGDEVHQRALLEEYEPLLFGYLRSLFGGAPESAERAARATHDLLVSFHLRLLAGGLLLTDAASLRSLAHRMSVAKVASLRAGARVRLAFLADPETWSLAGVLPSLARRIGEALGPGEDRLLATLLAGEPGAALPETARGRLAAAGLLEA